MSDLKISQLPALSGSDLASADQLAVVDSSASQTSKLTVGDLIANGVTLINDNTIPGAKILFDSGSIATAALADSGVTTVKIAADAITSAKIADNVIVALASTLPTSGGFIGQLALDTDDNSLYVWSGTAWLNTKAPASVNAFTDTTAGIVNITTTVSSGTATITASIDNTASAAQFLAGPVGSGGTVGYRTIDGGDLPTATTTSKGGVIVNGGGLALSTDTIQIDNSVTPSSVKHLVTYNANGLITGGSAITSSDLPTATNSAKGAVSVPTNEGLAVDASGNLSINNTVTSGTYTKVTVTAKGVVSAGDTLDAADIPDHSAAKLTSGTINTSLIANDSITAEKLANESTVKFGGALGSDNVTIFPDGDFKGQLFWDETSLDLYVYTGSAFIPITVLSGNLVNAGTYNANTNLVSSVTTAGSSAGFSAGSALPAPAGANLNHYVVVETSGTGSGAAPAVALAPPDMLLSNGVGTEYRLIDVSNAIAGQTAANISFIASGTIAATDVQAALQEVDSEKLAIAGGTMTGDLNLGTSTNVVFEGSSADDYETTLTVTNPTADRTITLPNVTGTVVTTGDTGSVTSAMIADGAIVNADINAGAEIAVSKLANGTARQLLQTDSGGSGVEFTSNVDVPGTLDVTSAATFDSTVAVTGLLSANGKLAYPAGSAAAVSLYSGSDTDTGIYSPGSNQFGIATAGTSRIIVDASGNVGVGTALPSAPLHITNASPKIILTDSDNSADISISSIGGAGVYSTAGDSIIQTNATERMRIDSSGRVGIGTTSPVGKTYIAGPNTSNFGVAADAALNIAATGGSLSNRIINLNFAVVPSATNAIASIGMVYQSQSGFGNGHLIFGTRSVTTDTAPIERLRIDSSGNVGIGTTSAFDTASGRGNISLNGASSALIALGVGGTQKLALFHSGTDCELNNQANGFLAFKTNNSERMRIDSSGNVGIGATSQVSSDVKLEVKDGIFAVTDSVNGDARIFLGSSTAPGHAKGQIRYSLADESLEFYANSTERLRIDSSGNVAIGATSSTSKLRVIGNEIRFSNSSNASYYGTITHDAASTGANIYNNNDGTAVSHIWQHNGTEKMRIDSSGRLGIGTSSPSRTLHVRGVSTAAQFSGTGGTAYICIEDADDGTIGFIGVDGGKLRFQTPGSNHSDKLVITPAGNVGIGDSSPSAKLEIRGASTIGTNSGHIVLSGDSAVVGQGPQIVFSESGSGGSTAGAYIGHGREGTNSIGFLSFGTRSSSDANVTPAERMRINSSGNVGIGTTSPSSALSVAGSIPNAPSGAAVHIGLAGNYAVVQLSESTGGIIDFAEPGVDNAGRIIYTHAADAMQFHTGTGGTERMRIDSSGRLLVGTSSALTGGGTQFGKFVLLGNSSGANSSGIVVIGRNHAATSLVAGNNVGEIYFGDTAAAHFASISCAADSSTGSSDYPGRLVFSTTADGASSPTERMRITSNGDIFVAVTNGTKTNEGFRIENSGQPNITRGTDGTFIYFYHTSGSVIGSIQNNGGTGTLFNTSSDYRLKENVVNIADGVDRVKQLSPKRFNFIADGTRTVDGFLAHEVQTIVPESISGEKDAVDENGDPVYQGIDQSKLVPLLTAALQEAIAKIETLETKVAALEAG